MWPSSPYKLETTELADECARRFPVPLFGNDNPQKTDKFVLSSPPDLKCIVTLTGDSITSADINFRIQRQQHVLHRTCIQSENPWKLQQIQDAGNHLQQAIRHIENIDKEYMFKSSDEVLHFLGNILSCLQRGRTSLYRPQEEDHRRSHEKPQHGQFYSP
ncbi:unnamed protein product, partial [Timema podura]|nr:unnamed protein product [Timema podura]